MKTLDRLARPAPIAAIAVLIAVAAALGFAALSAQAQTRPGAPTGLTTQGAGSQHAYGDTEMRLVWTAPAAGDCPATDYLARVIRASNDVIYEQGITPNTVYVATKLIPSTAWDVEVWAYGASCGRYSAAPATYSLPATNAVSSSNDPQPPANQPMMLGNPPGAITVSKSGTSATLSWTAPTADSDRCPHTDYSMAVLEYDNDYAVVAEREYITSTSQTFTGLTAGTKYIFEVWSYSDHPCSEYSPGAYIVWTQ